jgi:hypothetical protein
MSISKGDRVTIFDESSSTSNSCTGFTVVFGLCLFTPGISELSQTPCTILMDRAYALPCAHNKGRDCMDCELTVWHCVCTT